MTTPPARPLRLIVGLGNPGAEYSETRHNAGFRFCERLADQLGVRFSHESRFHGLVANAREAGVWLLMPQTFMNRSGQAVGALARFYRIEPAEILIVHDELDIPPGQLRLKFGGGLGGHNGLKDTSAHLNTHDYWRLRIGIGHPGNRSEVVGWVLRRPPEDEMIGIEQTIDRAVKAFPDLVRGDMTKATQIIHTAKPPRPKPPRKEPPSPEQKAEKTGGGDPGNAG